MDMSSLSCVITGKSTNNKINASEIMAMAVLKAKPWFICLIPNIINGILNSTSQIETEIPVNWAVKSEIPVTPPSIKWLGIKKPFRPKAASITAKDISRMLPILILKRSKFLDLLVALIAKNT